MTEDKRATPSERTKTLEEIAAEEKEQLEEMERRRRARMELKVAVTVLSLLIL